MPLDVWKNIELPQLQLEGNYTNDCTQVYATGILGPIHTYIVLIQSYILSQRHVSLLSLKVASAPNNPYRPDPHSGRVGLKGLRAGRSFLII